MIPPAIFIGSIRQEHSQSVSICRFRTSDLSIAVISLQSWFPTQCPTHTDCSQYTDECSINSSRSTAPTARGSDHPSTVPRKAKVQIKGGWLTPNPATLPVQWNRYYTLQGSKTHLSIHYGCDIHPDKGNKTVYWAFIERFDNPSADVESVLVVSPEAFAERYEAELKTRRITGSIEVLRDVLTKVWSELADGTIKGLPSWVQQSDRYAMKLELIQVKDSDRGVTQADKPGGEVGWRSKVRRCASPYTV